MPPFILNVVHIYQIRALMLLTFTKHMNKLIQVMDIPEASVASLWEILTCSHGGRLS